MITDNPKTIDVELTKHAKELERELFYLWMFLSKEELLEEAQEFLDERFDCPVYSKII